MIHLKAAAFALAVVGVTAVDWRPYELIATFADGHHEVIPTTDRDSCNTAVRAVYRGLWELNDATGRAATALVCTPGDAFKPAEMCIAHYNCGTVK